MAPKTIDQAVDQILTDLEAAQFELLRKVDEGSLPMLSDNLSCYIQHHFQLWHKHSELLKDCRKQSDNPKLHPYDASALIVRRLWEFLRQEMH